MVGSIGTGCYAYIDIDSKLLIEPLTVVALMTNSGRWLVFSGKIEEARKSLQFVTPDMSELAIAEIQVTIYILETLQEAFSCVQCILA